MRYSNIPPIDDKEPTLITVRIEARVFSSYNMYTAPDDSIFIIKKGTVDTIAQAIQDNEENYMTPMCMCNDSGDAWAILRALRAQEKRDRKTEEREVRLDKHRKGSLSHD